MLVDELVRGGVRDVVLCPGSRSAPLAYAVLAAERSGRLRLHVRVDERSAGFLALGLARGSGAPVAVMTTSGTAVANLHPAVLEAHHAGTPLVVVSADRPHELRGTGANQTTDTARHSSGRAPGTPSTSRHRSSVPGSARSGAAPSAAHSRPPPAPRAGSQGPSTSTSACASHWPPSSRPPPAGGGPRAGLETDDAWPEALEGRADGKPWVVVGDNGPGFTDAAALAEVARTLVFVGVTRDPALGERAVAWATERGHPVVAEPFGSAALRAEAVPHGPLLLTATDWLDGHAPGPGRGGRPADPVQGGRRPPASPRPVRRGGVRGRPVARPLARRLRRAPSSRPPPRRPHDAR